MPYKIYVGGHRSKLQFQFRDTMLVRLSRVWRLGAAADPAASLPGAPPRLLARVGGSFVADIQPGGPSDLLMINGSASLSGAVQIHTLAPNFAPGEQFRIISTNVPVTGIFDTATVTGPTAPHTMSAQV